MASKVVVVAATGKHTSTLKRNASVASSSASTMSSCITVNNTNINTNMNDDDDDEDDNDVDASESSRTHPPISTPAASATTDATPTTKTTTTTTRPEPLVRPVRSTRNRAAANSSSKDSHSVRESRLPRKKRRDSCEERVLFRPPSPLQNSGSFGTATGTSAAAGEDPTEGGATSTSINATRRMRRGRGGLDGSLGSVEEETAGRIRAESSLDDGTFVSSASHVLLHSPLSLDIAVVDHTVGGGSSHLPLLDELHHNGGDGGLNGGSRTSHTSLLEDPFAATSTILPNAALLLLNHEPTHERESKRPSVSPTTKPPKLLSSSLDQLDPLLNVDDHHHHPVEDASKIVADALADHDILLKLQLPAVVPTSIVEPAIPISMKTTTSAAAAAAASVTTRPSGDDDEVSLTSSGHGLLLLDALGISQDLMVGAEATAANCELLANTNESTATGHDDTDRLGPLHQLAAVAAVPEDSLAAAAAATTTTTKTRERQDSMTTTTAQSCDRWDAFAVTIAAAHTRERIDSIGNRLEVATTTTLLNTNTTNNPLPFATGVVGRERCDSWMGRRDRLESWGGMSDLSVPVANVAPPSSILLLEDPQLHFSHPLHGAYSATQDQNNISSTSPAATIPTRISLQRDRLNSIASLGETLQRDRVNSIASLGDLSLSAFAGNALDGMEVASDIQAFVAAAMATVGDQLMELAGEMEEVAGDTMNFEDFKREMGFESEGDGDDSTSIASPLIGAVSDAAHSGRRGRARTWSTSSGRISVDLDAVLAAVDAADAASGSLGLVSHSQGHAQPSTSMHKKRSTRDASSKAVAKEERANRRSLPLKRKHRDSNSSSSIASVEQPRRRKDAFPDKAVGGRTKRGASGQTKTLPPLKKRGRRSSPDTPATVPSMSIQPTPKVSNRTISDRSNDAIDVPPMIVSSSCVAFSDAKQAKQAGQASQKWEAMYECLLDFALERQIEETKNMTDAEKQCWIWDGNVPTNYKTKDGKALGRWVNNQRSAKSKGNLKDDREERLIEAGLKWSVLASNCWNEMLEELSIYIKDQHRQGKVWDGNVPTNYQIKTRPFGGFNGEDKNLGRWINRQRSMFQAGRLRKDRQRALEGIGLKWSMLATTSWDSMYDTLTEYIDKLKKTSVASWDGNVPANHRTNHHPPRSLGRWVNRQRSAYAKNKLKKECADKLTALGLKWSVHSRFDDLDEGDDGEFMDEFAIPEKVVPSNATEKEIVESKPMDVVINSNIQAV